jgi:L-aspartate semialdehyde sulfurtransferase ferredoxin
MKSVVRVLLRFAEEVLEEPIVSKIILQLKVPINIIAAHVDSKGGEVLAEVPEESLDKVVAAFRERGVLVSLPKLIEVDTEKCISCGSCVTLCPVEAITFEADASVKFDKEKCLGSTCSACVDACPARAIKSVKNGNSNSH